MTDINRRTFLRLAAGGALATRLAPDLGAVEPEILYNGIRLATPWPPRLQMPAEHPVLPPYLAQRPDVIPIDIGRQLLVDDFLVEETTLNRTFHAARYHPASPVLRPERPWELRDEYADRTQTRPNPAAMVFSDGVFYDPADRLFKMWYMGGYQMNTCLAVSEDGLNWQRPTLRVVPGTNIVQQLHRDSSTVWLDLNDAGPARYKLALWRDHHLELFVSPDGVQWSERGRLGPVGDRTTFFWNPFRRVWVFSIRADQFATQISGRYRRYWESAAFPPMPAWNDASAVGWVKADSADFARPMMAGRPELYNLDCVAYESVMLGLFTIWRGESRLREKVNEITVGFSRDGFHWHRPDRGTFIGVAEEEGSWNWANVQSAGGCCVAVGDELYFYVSGRQGVPGTNAPGICSTGVAVLRRDGFTSMDWLPDEAPVIRLRSDGSKAGVLTTRPLRFSGSHLFVNADLRGGELRVEVLDVKGNAVAPFTRAACVPVKGNETQLAVTWPGASLADLSGTAVRFRFTLTEGRLFAFWVSPSAAGESRGYPAAGGPERRMPPALRPSI